ncbi:MAG: aminotransferase class IV [Bacteroidales bacterium]|nr:aminotransferase class IV [Bacteroidales bacterium]
MTTFSEVIKLKDGRLYNLSYHQDRVSKTVADFYKKNIDLSIIKSRIPPEAVKGLFKCRLLYNDKIEKVEFTPYTFRSIEKVGVIVCDDINYSYKYADRTIINKLLQLSDCDDILIIKNGFVTDGSASNLVLQSSGDFYTPKDYLLPGTKRKFLLDTGRIMEKSIPVQDISKFDYIYFINAMIDLEDDIKVDVSTLIYL